MTNTLRNCWFIYVAGKSRDLQSAERERATVGFITDLARKIHDFRNTEGLAMVQIRCLGRFETKNEAFA
jgi:hypothetical protein